MCGSWREHWRTSVGIVMLLLVAAVPALGQGRGKIAGKVVDASTGAALPGVNVVIVGTTLGTATDAVGDYFISNLQPGTYDVRATFIGYNPMTVQGVSVSNNTTAEVNFSLQEETFEVGGEVVVTAQRPLVERDKTTSMVRLETEEITARPTSNFEDVLTSLPSINMENGEMTIRGGSIDEVAFVVDGARARDPLTHQPYTRFNLGAIEELEVITGSFNAEYGEARSGVINVITKEGGEQYEGYVDARFEPPGTKHWGTSLYDRSADIFWENTHARHLEWWIEYPDQWVDPNGIPGSDPRSAWTPEEAYENYLETHQPLTDYTETPTYEAEVGFGGPVPLLRGLTFFGTYKQRSEAPIAGNAYRDKGTFTDATLKVAYRMSGGRKLTLSGFFGEQEAGWGFVSDPGFNLYGYPFWAVNYGIDSRYAYYDQVGYPYSQTNGQTLTFSHVLNTSSFYELKLTRVRATRRVGTIPGDPIGFEASEATRDNLRAVDEEGNPIPGGFANRIGYHTSGYIFRFDDRNTEYEADAYYSNQVNKNWHLKTGVEVSRYVLDHFNQSKYAARTDSAVYRPYQGAAYVQNKFEFQGFILNGGLRLDFYDPNDEVYADLFDPLAGEKQATGLYFQLSPRLGVSHPIDTKTVLHFSYGHFFQRPAFGDYGETYYPAGNLTTVILDDVELPWTLGNRNLRPRKLIAFELGLERNFWDFFVLDVTGYYKDIRNTIRGITIEMDNGATYSTNGNGDYGDFRGAEFSVRKVPSSFPWGSFWGYANYSVQFEIEGRSGAPAYIAPNSIRYNPSGDNILYHNPHFKAGLYYETPTNWQGVLGALFGDLSISADFTAVRPHEQLRSDYFFFEGEKYLRDVNQSTSLRARKEISLPGGVHLSPYLEVRNLFNDRWVNLGAFEQASLDDQRQMVESDFEDLPTVTANGTPILDVAKYRNLPRAVLFGVTMNF